MPALLGSNSACNDSSTACNDSLSLIVLSFVSAVRHVPVHRRGTVFESLIVTCRNVTSGATSGNQSLPVDPLPVVWLALAVHHVMSHSSDESSDESSSVQDPSDYSELMTSLISRFSVRHVIDSTFEISQFLVQLKFELKKDEIRKNPLLDPAMVSTDYVTIT